MKKRCKEVNTVWDYLDWRGDLTFLEAEFNPIDNLVLSILAYLNFDAYVSKDGSEKPTLRNIMRRYTKIEDDEVKSALITQKETWIFARRVAKTRRFGSLRLVYYESVLADALHMQFAAITFLLPNRTAYVAFRGTDHSIVGWREDFRMSFGPVASQLYATKYLEKVSRRLFGFRLLVGGHSKGGNLAVWSGVHACRRTRRRIKTIYSNDSPGFDKTIIDSDPYKDMSKRIKSFVTPASIVGMLLEHDQNYKVVNSNQIALMQHDPFSWEVLGCNFVYLKDRSKHAKKADAALRRWIGSLTKEERREIIQIVFSVLESTDAKTVTEIGRAKLKSVEKISKAILALDRQSKEQILYTIKKLFEQEKNGAE